jgi:predicted RNA-binding Zn-ribbon protein involved in translation (DUF1610 family)
VLRGRAAYLGVVTIREVTMASAVTCKQCGFQAPIELHLGQLASFSPEQAKMMQRCRRAAEPGFAYDCDELTLAFLKTLEHQARFPQSPLGLKMATQRAQHWQTAGGALSAARRKF